MQYLRDVEDGVSGDVCRETIEEEFGIDVRCLNGVVYGGAVRDMLSGTFPKGDLDILAHTKTVMKITVEMILESGYGLENVTVAYGNLSNLIKNVTTFSNSDDKKVQLIETSGIDAMFKLMNATDLACCAVFLQSEGEAVEIVPGAGGDCRKKILRANTFYSRKFDVTEHLTARVAKLEKRGWVKAPSLTRLMNSGGKKK